jgi:hypothetical protein
MKRILLMLMRCLMPILSTQNYESWNLLRCGVGDFFVTGRCRRTIFQRVDDKKPPAAADGFLL